MKKNKRLWLATIATLLCGTMVNAHDFEDGGVYYKIVSSADHTVAVTYQGNSYASNKEYSGDLVIPSIVLYGENTYSVTHIAANAFAGCDGLTSVSLPVSVTGIGEYAFDGCSNLTTITCKATAVPRCDVNSFTNLAKENVTLYVSQALFDAYNTSTAWSGFYGVISCPSGECGDNLTWWLAADETLSIDGHGAMYDYGGEAGSAPWSGYRSSISHVVLHNGMTSIGDLAFDNLYKAMSINIPESVTEIGSFAFYNCDSLTSVVVPSGVTSLEPYTFQSCDTLSSLTLPEGLMHIGKAAISNCRNLKQLTLPCSLETIGEYAFDKSGMESIVIPASVTAIGNVAFSRCPNLKEVILSEGLETIGTYAFEYTPLKSLVIPASVTSIGGGAFMGCTNLKYVTCKSTIPPALTISESLTSFKVFVPAETVDRYKVADGWDQFENLMGVLGSGTCGDDLFWWLTTEGELVIEGNGAMTDYARGEPDPNTPWKDLRESILSITIKEGVTTVGEFAFSGCSNLKSVSLPNTLRSLGYDAFAECYLLNSINIPDGVTIIDRGVFYHCEALSSITIPSSVVEIGYAAFMACYNLAEITVKVDDPLQINLAEDVFKSVDKEFCKLYVPRGSRAAYQSANVWKEFANIIRMGNEYQVAYTIDGDTLSTGFIVAGDGVAIPVVEEREGYTFSGWTAEIPVLQHAGDALTYDLYSNALCSVTTYGDQFVGWYVLFDGDANTFFHSNYSDADSDDGLDHYLRVDMGEGNTISQFAFTYTVRGNDATYTPACIVVEGSNEANGIYERIDSLTNLPTKTAEVYQSGLLGNGNAYRYIRYRVTKTVYGNLDGGGHPYTYFAEFRMSEHLTIDEDATSIVMPTEDITIYGNYIPNNYTVTYMQADTVVAIDTIPYTTDIVPAEAPQRDYYTFAEWVDLPATMPAEDLVVTAKYALTLNDSEVNGFVHEGEEELSSLTYTRTLPNMYWNSLYVPFEIELTEEFLADYDVAYFNDIHSYDTDDDGDIDDMEMEVIKIKSGTLKANYPYLVRAKSEEAQQMSICIEEATIGKTEEITISCSSVFMQFAITGTYSQMSSESLAGKYVISTDGAWQPVAEEATLGAFRLYLIMTTLDGSPVKVDEQAMQAISIRTRGESEGTTSIENSEIRNQNSESIYDLFGRSVETMTKGGIYIVNGKKVIR